MKFVAEKVGCLTSHLLRPDFHYLKRQAISWMQFYKMLVLYKSNLDRKKSDSFCNEPHCYSTVYCSTGI